MKKTYVRVLAEFDLEGNILPKLIYWEGREIFIDRVVEKVKTASLKVGGVGIRYKIKIGNKITYLFYEFDKWFVEEK